MSRIAAFIIVLSLMVSGVYAYAGTEWTDDDAEYESDWYDDYDDNASALDFDVTASSYYEENNPSVAPWLACDGDTSTGWDSWGEHEGAWFEIDYGCEQCISGFYIINGKPMRNGNRDYYYKNSRVKAISVYIDDAFIGSFQLEDTWKMQIRLFSKTYAGTVLRFEITSVYRGSEYSNPNYGVCITEIGCS